MQTKVVLVLEGGIVIVGKALERNLDLGRIRGRTIRLADVTVKSAQGSEKVLHMSVSGSSVISIGT